MFYFFNERISPGLPWIFFWLYFVHMSMWPGCSPRRIINSINCSMWYPGIMLNQKKTVILTTSMNSPHFSRMCHFNKHCVQCSWSKWNKPQSVGAQWKLQKNWIGIWFLRFPKWFHLAGLFRLTTWVDQCQEPHTCRI